MGGENEQVLTKKTGDNATDLNGFRIHENNGEAHFHDDKSGLKCAVPMGAWWKGWEKIRGEIGTWKYVDPVNKTQVSVETRIDNSILDVIINVTPIIVGSNYSKLNIFSKRK